MKNILLLGTIILLGAGGWYIFTSEVAAPSGEEGREATEDTQSVQSTENTAEVSEETNINEPMMENSIDSSTEVNLDEAMITKSTFTVAGVNFAFDVKEIIVQEGDIVTINFESTEGFHDWVVDEFNAATSKVRPGTPTSVTFVADKVGTYEYYCSVGNHRLQGMVGKLIVE